MDFKAFTAQALKRLLGRRTLWKLGRTLYYVARHDPENSMARNGEFALQLHLARHAAATATPWTVFDIGANVGEWSAGLLAAAREAGVPNVHLIAFEPEPTAASALKARLADVAGPNDVVRVVPMALSDVPGRAPFMVHGAAAGSNGLAAAPAALGEGTIQVDVTTLDLFVPSLQLNGISLLKIDAEGFDMKILQGAKDVLRTGVVGVFQFEYNWRWVATRSFLADAFELAAGGGYHLGKLVPDGVELYGEWHPELERFIEGNYVLVRDDLLSSVAATAGHFDASNTYDRGR